jgi:peptidoglycan/LPS O-acetylase OafA/YrhL
MITPLCYAEKEGMRIDRLDGIRAIAILLVLLFHRGFLSQGWMGVDLFFVLSGFLITGILRKTRTQERYWLRFYTRRAARILPPVLMLMLLYTLAAKPPLPTILGYTLFAGNVMNRTAYGRSMLGSLWSLAVEEHFYLFWPVIVLLFDRRRLIIGLAALLVAEPVVRAVMTPYMATYEPFYYLTPFRLDSLAAGSLLALLMEGDVTLPAQRLAGWIGALLASTGFIIHALVPSFVRHSNNAIFNSLGYSLVSATAFCLVAWVMSLEAGLAKTMLSWKPLTYLGRISYGAYLLDVPVTASMDHLARRSSQITAPLMLVPIDLAVIFGLAALSFHFIEQPIIRFARIRSEMVVEGGEYWWRTEN